MVVSLLGFSVFSISYKDHGNLEKTRDLNRMGVSSLEVS